MNDPHVECLHYKIKHRTDVDYANAPPLVHNDADFRVEVDSQGVKVRPKMHHATVESARTMVDPFLRAWELSAALKNAPGELRFVYESAEIIDRNPTPGLIQVTDVVAVSIVESVSIKVLRGSYPEPPSGIARDATVDLMFARYEMYRDSRTTLADAAYYCLTVLEATAVASGSKADRAAAAKHYGIDETVLRKVGELTGIKGGSEARKFFGSRADFTSGERAWLETALPLLIRRAAEVAFDPLGPRRKIALNDLPLL